MTEKAISTLSALPNTKEQLFNFAQKLQQELLDGEIEPLEMLRYRKYMEKLLALIKETLDVAARCEAEKYGQKTFIYKDMKIEIAENGTTYDYTNCNDPVLPDLVLQADYTAKLLKDRQAFLKGIKGTIEIVSENGGTVHTVYPPIKRSTSGLKCELQ